jgi:hypothetical protein
MEAPAATPEKVIFLDIDGVLNTGTQQPNGFTTIGHTQASQLNALLLAEPKAQLVISSAWRYLCLNGSMTLQGFEAMLLTHGVNCHGRVYACTESDERTAQRLGIDAASMELEGWHRYLKMNGAAFRMNQVLTFAADQKVQKFVVLDDMPFPEIAGQRTHQVVVNRQYGLRPVDVDAARVILK